MVKHLCVKYGAVVDTVVCDGCISRRKFQVCNTVCKAAQCKRDTDIAENFALAVCLGFHQRGKPKFFQVVKRNLRGNLLHHTAGNNIHRAVDCAPDRGKTFINIPVPVCNLGVSTRIMIFRVIRH